MIVWMRVVPPSWVTCMGSIFASRPRFSGGMGIRMARFIVADISDAKAVLQELRAIVPDLPSVPVQPIILATQEEPGMFDFYRNRPSFLNVHRYASQEQLIADLGEKVIRPAELKVLDLRGST